MIYHSNNLLVLHVLVLVWTRAADVFSRPAGSLVASSSSVSRAWTSCGGGPFLGVWLACVAFISFVNWDRILQPLSKLITDRYILPHTAKTVC